MLGKKKKSKAKATEEVVVEVQPVVEEVSDELDQVEDQLIAEEAPAPADLSTMGTYDLYDYAAAHGLKLARGLSASELRKIIAKKI